MPVPNRNQTENLYRHHCAITVILRRIAKCISISSISRPSIGYSLKLIQFCVLHLLSESTTGRTVNEWNSVVNLAGSIINWGMFWNPSLATPYYYDWPSQVHCSLFIWSVLQKDFGSNYCYCGHPICRHAMEWEGCLRHDFIILFNDITTLRLCNK